MLKGLLDKKACADCKICCGFDNTDIWEMPLMTKKTADTLLKLKPDTKLIENDIGYTADAGELKDGEIFFCPALDHEKGCILGDDKPFECSVWPYRVMETEDKRFRMITISPVCDELYNRPLSQICKFMKENLENALFEYAELHPEIIKPYNEGYPILAFRDQK